MNHSTSFLDDISVEILKVASYGTLALSDVAHQPYVLPINFVCADDSIYFHGSKKGKKNTIINENKKVSFSVVNSFSLIPSCFPSDNEMACSANHYYNPLYSWN